MSSLVTVLLPFLLLTTLSATDYAVWALVYSLSTYVLYLDFGLPTTVQVMVGRDSGNDGAPMATRIVAAACRCLGIVSLGLVVVVAGTAASIGVIFPGIPITALAQASALLAVLSLGQLSNVVSNTLAGYFAGLQRSHVPAATLAPARAISMAAAFGLSLSGGSLFLIGVGFAVPLVIGALLLAWFIWIDARVPANRSAENRTPVRMKAVIAQSGPLVIWNVSMILVSASGTAIVAWVDFRYVAAFSLGVICTTALAGVQSAALSPLLPEMGRRFATRETDSLGRLVRRVATLNSTIVIVMSTIAIGLVPYGVTLLLPEWRLSPLEFAVMLTCMMFATSIRLSMAPLTYLFIASGTHTRVIIQPAIEGVLTVVAAATLGSAWGAVGVSVGLLIGAILGTAIAATWSLKASGIGAVVPLGGYTLSSVVRPFALGLPGAAVLIALYALSIQPALLAWGVLATSSALLSVSVFRVLAGTLSPVRAIKGISASAI